MARLLVVGGGCRALDLARALRPEGHALRMVTRREERRAEIEEAAGECVLADPDVVGTLRYALDNVTLLLWLLGTASGPPEAVAALHGSRWAMMLERTVDTTVRGVVYESGGTVPAEALAAGRRQAEAKSREHGIPLRVLRSDPRERERWLAEALGAVGALLAA